MMLAAATITAVALPTVEQAGKIGEVDKGCGFAKDVVLLRKF